MSENSLHDPVHTRSIRRAVLAGVFVLLALAAGCSSDSGSQDSAGSSSPSPTVSTSTSASPDVCAAVDTTKASLQALVDTKVAQEGTDTLKARFATFESDVQTLVDSGQAALAPKAAAVTASVDGLKATLANLQASPTATDLALVKPALLAVKTSTEDLITAVRATC